MSRDPMSRDRMSRDMGNEAVGQEPEAGVKAVWVTPSLTPARVADETEAKSSSSIERTSLTLKNGS